ncbi:RAQPRD family integrative conjugative element protein [Pseudomonas aeruginosa]|uniref:integrative conjugative element protein, RAQPRD family n=1 Tax=Pseudomonas aeruginosa TaxID=287 RepID=UPI000F533784|nr:RAQPRD family integrative conjugative element protein [Pseudomonas aeruginosa]RPS62706.1 raqprd family integrative conjugative element protein [Pseudomonas aeruginosa]HBO3041388.1 RAQPRD family integrative conjugative element protein [Pseudomonas aeruginosa]HCF0166872.1 RAQPRD family integrative conjugative element protein [Pseudomonas aeruginosa]
MTTTGKPTTDCRRAPALALVLAVALTNATPASAGDASPEHAQLATLARQLDLIDRLAEHAAHTAPQQRARYHFDHARLRKDLQRVRTGIQDYLTPPRAQPRDPVELSGDYRQSSPISGQEVPR